MVRSIFGLRVSRPRRAPRPWTIMVRPVDVCRTMVEVAGTFAIISYPEICTRRGSSSAGAGRASGTSHYARSEGWAKHAVATLGRSRFSKARIWVAMPRHETDAPTAIFVLSRMKIARQNGRRKHEDQDGQGCFRPIAHGSQTEIRAFDDRFASSVAVPKRHPRKHEESGQSELGTDFVLSITKCRRVVCRDEGRV